MCGRSGDSGEQPSGTRELSGTTDGGAWFDDHMPPFHAGALASLPSFPSSRSSAYLSEMPSRLPIFPLSGGAVSWNSACRCTSSSHGTSGCWPTVWLRTGVSVSRRCRRARDVPEPGTIGCVAEVRVNQELPDGRSNIVVLGGSRFVLSRLLEESLPYLVAHGPDVRR